VPLEQNPVQAALAKYIAAFRGEIEQEPMT
jgi:hypothetical protein